ncbi:MAG: Mov34/MPN/PAD-1 family protein [Candidatus Loosdrechtia sp.]|uniref:Mov34/MPN/PAD-1 family protein n=1 Tax=Candidatus Loosdrechtia sp. TaxID=3101272 RepID=UPI003A72A954|nr:MAG: M67 family metallopeptidase [Candidatus Jettenia sp. AMX2]
MLFINKNEFHEIEEQVKKNYPLECCGLLLGKYIPEKRVIEIYPAQNKNTERTHDRYEIDGKEFASMDREAGKKGLQIIGIYHSHPDHPPVPSAFDTERAWPGYSYIIIAIEKGRKIEARSWVFDEVKKQFEEEEIRI